MKIQNGKPYAVLTDDIVGSSKLKESGRIRLHQLMKQGSAERMGLLYRALIRVRMKSKLIDTRLAIALGTIDFLPDQCVSSGDGEAFRRPGVSLENMSKSGPSFSCLLW